MITKVRKWGNSLGVRLPKSAALEVGVRVGAEVDVSASDGRIVVRPVKPARPRLRELLVAVNRGNLHAEAFLDAARGCEQL
ncbi:MAG: AbrB/MazE/SpoVT family DNA-binding domain-containing protein [Elusimicrobia bacterium]|nr:AbrB/MazE/SpoVT family DNA-binding domain-containing protein [Elusimicrobiota bacterium]